MQPRRLDVKVQPVNIGEERFSAVAVEVPRVDALAEDGEVPAVLLREVFSLEGETERPQSQLVRER